MIQLGREAGPMKSFFFVSSGVGQIDIAFDVSPTGGQELIMAC